MGVRDLFLIALYVVAVPASFLQPFVGVLFWAWISYFNPQDFTWGLASHIPIGYLVAIPTVLGLAFTKIKQAPPLTLQTLLLVVLWLWFCLTTANVFLSAELKHHSADTVAALWQVSKTFAMFLIALMLITDFQRLRWWYLVTGGSFALFALKIGLWGVATGGAFRAYGPRNSMIYDNNDFGVAMNMALPMFIGLAKTERSRWLARCFKAAVPMGIIAVILTYSRGALLGLVVVLAAMVMKSRRRLPALIAALVLAAIVFVAAPGKWVERMQTLRDVNQDQSAQARFHSWTFSYRLVRNHPVLGGGFQTHTPELYLRYNIKTDHVQGPHSIYFQVLGEHGFPGLMLFLLLAFSSWWSGGKLARHFLQHSEFTGSEESRELYEYAKMVQLSLIPFLISGAFLGLAYFDLYYQLVATVVLLKSFAQRLDWSPVTEEVAEENSIPALAN